MTTATARTSRSRQMLERPDPAMIGSLIPPPSTDIPTNPSASSNQEPYSADTPDDSSSPEVHRSYSPLSEIVTEAAAATAPSNPTLSEDGSSDLSDLDEQSEGRMSQNSDERSDDGSASENETEAETERLHISPQKAHLAVKDEDSIDTSSRRGVSRDRDTTEAGFTAREIDDNGHDEADEVDDVLDDIDLTNDRGMMKSPVELAGRKRKRNGQLSPPTERLSLNDGPARKRSAPMTRRSFGIQSAPPPIPDPDNNVDEEDDALSSEDETAPVEAPEIHEASPEIADVQEDPQTAIDEEIEVVVDNDDDLAEVTAKGEADERRGRALASFKPIEALFAIFRDKVFNERWTDLSAELEQLKEDETTHPDYLAMRRAVDERRDEKLRVEQVYLKYDQERLQRKILATRAQLHSQCYQRIRQIRESRLAELNMDFCQIQRERRQFRLKDVRPTYKFEADRVKQIEQQTQYNKEVSLLAGIAKYRGFPAAPDIQSATTKDIDEDLKAMKIQPTAQPVVAYAAQVADPERAAEVAAQQSFLEHTVWANPNHPIIRSARMTEGHISMGPIATSTSAAQAWMLPSLPTPDTRPSVAAPVAGISKASLSDTTLNGSSPFEHVKRNEAPRRSNHSTPIPPTLNAVNPSPPQARVSTKSDTVSHFTISSPQQSLAAPNLHSNGTTNISPKMSGIQSFKSPANSFEPLTRERETQQNNRNDDVIGISAIESENRSVVHHNRSASITPRPQTQLQVSNQDFRNDPNGQMRQRFHTPTNSSTQMKDTGYTAGAGPGTATPEKIISSVGVR